MSTPQSRYRGLRFCICIFLVTFVALWTLLLSGSVSLREVSNIYQQRRVDTSTYEDYVRCIKNLSKQTVHPLRKTHDALATTCLLRRSQIVGSWRVVLSVFYGRRKYLEILRVYLKRNLRANGGVVDEVQLIMLTEDPEDIDFAEKAAKQDGFVTYRTGVNRHFKAFYNMSGGALAPGSVVIKIDDDTVLSMMVQLSH